MPATQTAVPPAPNLRTEELAREIAIDCDRALRRLDRLNRECDDVVLMHARAFIRHAATLSHAIERGGLAASRDDAACRARREELAAKAERRPADPRKRR